MIEKEWRAFCLACFGNVTGQQYIDLRRTFFGGASALYFVIMKSLSSGQDPTAEDLTMMRDLQRELQVFNEDVKMGRA